MQYSALYYVCACQQALMSAGINQTCITLHSHLDFGSANCAGSVVTARAGRFG